MQTGFITFESMEYDDVITAAADFGFDYVEFMMPYIAPGTELGREYISEHADSIRSHAETADIELSVHLPHAVDIGAPSDRVRQAGIEELKACLRSAAAINANKAVIHPTSSARKRTWGDDIVQEWIIDSINELMAFSDEHGIELCMENIPGTRFTIDDFDRFFADTECSMTLDTGHARISGYSANDIAGFLESHRDRVSHVHVNDNKQFVVGGTRRPSDDHVPTGAGDLAFDVALKPIIDNEWEGSLSIEVQTQSLEYIKVSKSQLNKILTENFSEAT